MCAHTGLVYADGNSFASAIVIEFLAQIVPPPAADRGWKSGRVFTKSIKA